MKANYYTFFDKYHTDNSFSYYKSVNYCIRKFIKYYDVYQQYFNWHRSKVEFSLLVHLSDI